MLYLQSTGSNGGSQKNLFTTDYYTGAIEMMGRWKSMTPQIKIPQKQTKKWKKKISLILFCTKSHHPWTRETSQIGFAQIQSDQRNFPYFSIHTSADCSFHWDKEILRACGRQAENVLG